MNKDKSYIIKILIAVFVIGFLSISSHSLWMDEAMRIEYSRITVENGYFDFCWNFMQVGLVHLLYFWEKLVGGSEAAFRMFNLPFLMIAAVYMLFILKKMKQSPLWLLLFAIHPLVTYYMNDASPYIPIMACTCAMLWHCFYTDKINAITNTAIILFWLTLGYSLHFIFGFAGCLYLCSLVYRWKNGSRLKSLMKDILVVIPFAVLDIYISLMYLEHMIHGSSRGWESPGIFNLASAGYCFIGLAGLGLPRNAMRIGYYHLITPTMIGLCGMMVISILILCIQNIRKLLSFFKEPAILANIIFAIVFLVAAYSRNFQFRERHVIFLYPMFFQFFVVLCHSAWQHKNKWLNRPWVILICALLFTSSAQLRFVKEYQKDDYRGAINCVKDNGFFNGHLPVLAQGEIFPYHYYNINVTSAIPALRPNTVSNTNRIDSNSIISITEELLQKYPAVCLILTEKEKTSFDLYVNAEYAFNARGYTTEIITEYNTFKVIFLSKPNVISDN